MKLISTFILISILLLSGCAKEKKTKNPFVGNWALVLPDGAAAWLTLSEDSGKIAGELWMVGAPKPLGEISIKEDSLFFTHKRSVGPVKFVGGPYTGPKVACRHVAVLSDDQMKLTMDKPLADGSLEKVQYQGKRIAPLPPKPDLSMLEFGEAIELFNGRNIDGWRLTNPGQTNCWKAVDGVLVNETPKLTFDPFARYGNLRTDAEFTDFNLQIDFKVPKGGNSGIYLRGMYEAQVVDRDSRMQGIHGVGAIFNRIEPTSMAGKAGDEWQHYDITLIDRHVTVILNGIKVIDNQGLAGCTNGALWSDESRPVQFTFKGTIPL